MTLFKQGLDLLAVNAQEEEAGGGAAGDFSNGIGQPHAVDIAGQAQQECHGQQNQQLAADGSDGGVDAVAQRLEAGTQGNAHRGDGEAPADGAQAAAADVEEFLRGIEQSQQHIG